MNPLRLALAALLIAAPGCRDASDDGAPASGSGPAKPTEGRWKPARTVDPELAGKIDDLEQMAYLSGSKPGAGGAGVMVHAKDHVAPGFNLYTSGHAPVAVLTDLDGEVLHSWKVTFEEAFPSFPIDKHEKSHFRQYFRRVRLFEDGGLLAIFEGHGMVKLDRDSRIEWTYDGKPHHDLEVTQDGEIVVLTREASVIRRINPREPVLEDFVVVLDESGAEQRRVSILDAFESSGYRTLLARMPRQGDIMHTNTVEVLDGSLAGVDEAFRAGNVLVSCLKTSTIAVIDLDAAKVVWAATGSWVRQHQPTVLDDGQILVFDNLGDKSGFGRSRVFELDPATKKIGWTYAGTAGAPFETATCGAGQRLENGNTLITESDNGRAFEVNAGGKIVWEFRSPHRAGPGNKFVATLFEVIRLPANTPLAWLE